MLRELIDDPAVEVTAPTSMRPAAPPSSLDSELFHALERVQHEMFPDAITLPTMLVAATDSAQLRAKGVQAYGVGTIRDEQGGVHGTDERISIEGLGLLYRVPVSSRRRGGGRQVIAGSAQVAQKRWCRLSWRGVRLASRDLLQTGLRPAPHATASRGPREPHAAAAGRACAGPGMCTSARVGFGAQPRLKEDEATPSRRPCPKHFTARTDLGFPGEAFAWQGATFFRRGCAPHPPRPLRGDPENPTPRPRGAHVRALGCDRGSNAVQAGASPGKPSGRPDLRLSPPSGRRSARDAGRRGHVPT